MAGLVDRHGPIDASPVDHEYQRLVVSIVNQQLSTASARAVRERVFDLFDGPVTPGAMLAMEEQPLLDAGLSAQKVEYVCNCARAFQDGDYTREGLSEYGNDEVIDELTAIRGVGEWTARMYLLFVLQRPDVLPLGDLAVRRGIEQLYNDGEDLTRAEMREIAEPWRPHRSRGTRYIWAEYESND